MFKQTKKIHFIGICGVAMSALAIAFHKKGHVKSRHGRDHVVNWEVSGSDAGFFPPISTHLENNKIDFYPGWHPDRVLHSFPRPSVALGEGGSEVGKNDPKDYLVVVGNVASSTNPEWLYVQQNNIEYKSYPEVIAEYFVRENSIVCAGTYGKTSTSALLSYIFIEAGLDPSYMFGGLSQNNIDSAHIGADDWSILEGDEYKSSRWDNGAKFLHYKPTNLLLTSVKWDHADIYPTEESYFDAFEALVKSIPENGLIVACTDDKKVRHLATLLPHHLITYGQSDDVDYQYYNVNQTKNGLSFEIKHGDGVYKIETDILGAYQAANITGAFAMARECGLEAEKIIKAIKSFKGIKRRLEKRLDGDITVIDDIAHSPQKAKSVLDTLRTLYNGKLIAIFEPNTGNRKPASLPRYANCFNSADTVIIPRLTKIKLDPTNLEKPISGDELSWIISKTHNNVMYIDDDRELIEFILKKMKPQGETPQRAAKSGSGAGDDCIVFLGSHGFRGMIEQLVSQLNNNQSQPKKLKS